MDHSKRILAALILLAATAVAGLRAAGQAKPKVRAPSGPCR